MEGYLTERPPGDAPMTQKFKWFWLLLMVIPAAVVEAQTLKVVSYNAMLVCVGPKCLLKDSPQRDERNVAIGPWLKTRDADIYFIQEVWNKSQYETLMREGKFAHGYYFENSDLAFFSKFPITEPQHYIYRWQASFETDCKRLSFAFPIGMGIAFIEPIPGTRIAVANAHNLPRWPEVAGFSDRADEHTPARKIHALEMIAALQSKIPAGTPVIFGGDFNMNQISEEYAFFVTQSGMKDVFRSVALLRGVDWTNACSFCGDNEFVKQQNLPSERILDFFFVSPQDFTVKDARFLPESARYSDHLALESILELKPASYSGIQPFLPSQDVLTGLQKYVDTIPISPWCWLSARGGWLQRSETTAFINKLVDQSRN